MHLGDIIQQLIEVDSRQNWYTTLTNQFFNIKTELDYQVNSKKEITNYLDASYSQQLVNILQNVNSKAIHNLLGEEALIWAWKSVPYSSHESYIMECTDYSIFNLKQAKKVISQMRLEDNISSLIKMHNSFSSIHTFSKEATVQDVLEKYSKIEMSEVDKESFSLSELRTKDTDATGYDMRWGTNIFPYKKGLAVQYDVFLDTPSALGLIYEGHLEGIIGFVPINENELLIKQIQGIAPRKGTIDEKGRFIPKISTRKNKTYETKYNKGLSMIEWEDTLVEFVEKFAFENKFSRVLIQKSEDNHWVKNDESKQYGLSLKSAIKIYDETAKRRGYECFDDYWVKSI